MNGDDSLDFLFRRDDYRERPRPDLVLLDLNFPRTNGDTILREMKGEPELLSIPVNVVTSSQSDADVITAYKNHAKACLQKPDRATEVIETITSVVELWFSLFQLPTDKP